MPGTNEFRICRIETHRQRKRRDDIEWQRIEFSVREFARCDVLQRMSMIVDRLDLVDFVQEIPIDSRLLADVRERDNANAQYDQNPFHVHLASLVNLHYGHEPESLPLSTRVIRPSTFGAMAFTEAIAFCSTSDSDGP